MAKSKITLTVQDAQINIIPSKSGAEDDYISLTDIARYKNPEEPFIVVNNWLRRKDTIEFLGLWETLNNPNFKAIEFDSFKTQAGSNAFTLSPKKWIESTNAIGLITKSGRYNSGTYAHKDIAFEFASWVSPEFKLFIIKEYQRLKTEESYRLSEEWDVRRLIASTNYRVQTDAIKSHLIAPTLTPNQTRKTYADEADLINVALFGMTAREWRTNNKDKKGNMRDYADIMELIILSNLENYNAIMIKEGIEQSERLIKLNNMAREQATLLTNNKQVKQLTD